MAGPGSRWEKIGTVFSRVQGLLRSGALKGVDRPAWFDVYEAFPPHVNPKPTNNHDRKIFYLEDIIRARFYNTYGNPEPIDMRDNSVLSPCQRFVEKYFELDNKVTEPSKLFQLTAEALREDGIALKSLEQRKLDQATAIAQRMKKMPKVPRSLQPENSMASMSMSPVEMAEAADTMDYEMDNPPPPPEEEKSDR